MRAVSIVRRLPAGGKSHSGDVVRTWTLHVGESFPDVPASHQFYAQIENLFHNGITGGCVGARFTQQLAAVGWV